MVGVGVGVGVVVGVAVGVVVGVAVGVGVVVGVVVGVAVGVVVGVVVAVGVGVNTIVGGNIMKKVVLTFIIGLLLLSCNSPVMTQIKGFVLDEKTQDQLFEMYCGDASELWLTCEQVTEKNRVPCMIQAIVCAYSLNITPEHEKILKQAERMVENED